jgi:hypothetical protein
VGVYNLEHLYALAMPGLAVVVTVAAACVVLNVVSLLYLATAAVVLCYPHVFIKPANNVATSPVWVSITALMAVIMISQYAALIGSLPSPIDIYPTPSSAPSPPSVPNNAYRNATWPFPNATWPLENNTDWSAETEHDRGAKTTSRLPDGELDNETGGTNWLPGELGPGGNASWPFERDATSDKDGEGGRRDGEDHELRVWFAVSVRQPLFVAVYAVVFYVYACHIRATIAAQQLRETSKAPFGGALSCVGIWSDLLIAARLRWTTLDRVRYYYYRYSVETVLVATFAVGTGPRDLLHAGYLIFLLTCTHEMWMHLRAYNYVMLVALAVCQANHNHNHNHNYKHKHAGATDSVRRILKLLPALVDCGGPVSPGRCPAR